jgi:hypothetical protein
MGWCGLSFVVFASPMFGAAGPLTRSQTNNRSQTDTDYRCWHVYRQAALVQLPGNRESPETTVPAKSRFRDESPLRYKILCFQTYNGAAGKD